MVTVTVLTSDTSRSDPKGREKSKEEGKEDEEEGEGEREGEQKATTNRGPSLDQRRGC